ncbi:heparan-alpha-glucosaminide N-acetyltransferase-like [Paramacrobiotus metropolitanus]|uniref:heparan-alpha-glucosaminide N-acetyltransferase-like n=1 Tax=Paramacrobiotus metropolitanus TaxID=2943436 RepID=UPI002446480A|nr:heparan-alpha-glucosaminide N-acetyltransferase-like [Paramacrobiotus metropolitanus]
MRTQHFNLLSSVVGLVAVCCTAGIAKLFTEPQQLITAKKYGVIHGAVRYPDTTAMDTASFFIVNSLKIPVTLTGQVEECEECPLVALASAAPGKESSVLVGTQYRWKFAVTNGIQDLCRFERRLWEYGRYHLTVSTGPLNATNCSVVEEENSHSAYTPLYVLLGLILGGIIIYNVGERLLRRFRSSLPSEHRFAFVSSSERSSSTSSDGSNATLTAPPPSRRLRSLDCFRGLTILLMIFVNCGAGGYWFLNHSMWNGLNLADLVFPWFLFIMGVAINISMRSAARKTAQMRTLWWNIIRRTCLLFLFGLMINSIGYKSVWELRLLSVLGRFSISYFFVAACELIFVQRMETAQTVTRWRFLRDIVPFWPTALFSMLFPLGQLLFTFLLPVPGCPRGYMGPGGLHHNRAYENCTGGAAGYIDRYILGENHIYQWPTCRAVYQCIAFDPEGILGYLNSTFLVFLGVQAGRILYLYDDHKEKLIRLVVWGIVLGLIAGGLCGFSQNDGWIPVNKNLWSLSFILTTASFGMILLALLYYVIDVQNVWSGTPFHYPSVNSIVLYIGSEILDNMFPFWWGMPQTHSGSLFMALWTTGMWWLISVWMYWQKIFVAL